MKSGVVASVLLLSTSCGLLMDFDPGAGTGGSGSASDASTSITTSSSGTATSIGSTGDATTTASAGGGGSGASSSSGGGSGLGGGGDPPDPVVRRVTSFGSDGDDTLDSIALGPRHEVVVAGRFRGSLEIGGMGPITVAAGNVGWFLALFDEDLSVVWLRKVSERSERDLDEPEEAEPLYENADHVEVAWPDDVILLGGTFRDDMDQDGDLNTDDASGPSDGFAAAYNTGHLATWTKIFAGGYGEVDDRFADPQIVRALATDVPGTDTMTLVGRFCGSWAMGGSCGDMISAACASQDLLLLDLGVDEGNCSVLQQFGGMGRQEATAVARRGDRIALGGTFEHEIDFGGGAALDGDEDARSFVAVLDRINPEDPSYVGASALTVGGAGAIEVGVDEDGGVFFGGGVLEPVAEVTSTLGGGVDLVVGSLESDGDPRFVRTFGGPEEDGGFLARRPERGGPLRAYGHFRGAADIGGRHVEADEGADAFVAELDDDGAAIWVEVLGGGGDQVISHALHDRAGREVLAGTHTGPMRFDDEHNLATPPGRDIWIALRDR